MPNSYDLRNKKILVTGSNGRLGKFYVQTLLANGAFVYAGDVHDNIDLSFKKKLARKKLSKYKYLTLDVTSESSLNSAETRIKETLDVLINNAGAKSVKGLFEERSSEDIDKVMDVNLKGVILCSKVFSRKMIKRRKGKIINIASIYGVVAPDKRIYDDPSKINSEIYGATKAGIIQFTKYLAAYLGEFNITANCISPGGVFHDGQNPEFVKKYSAKTSLGRMASAKDLADSICFFSSDGASYINGQNIVIDGGFSIW